MVPMLTCGFDLSNFSGEDVRFKFRFGADGVIDSYEGWYFDDVELTDTTGSLFSDDMRDIIIQTQPKLKYARQVTTHPCRSENDNMVVSCMRAEHES